MNEAYIHRLESEARHRDKLITGTEYRDFLSLHAYHAFLLVAHEYKHIRRV